MPVLHLEITNTKAMKKVLVPVDFSEESVNAFRFAVDLAAKSGGTIGLLHVIALPVLHDAPLISLQGLRKPLIDELKTLATERLIRLVDEFNGEGVKVQVQVLISHHIHRTITDLIKQENFDIVVMGTKGVSGIREWMVGSNAEKIVRTSPVPVVAVKQYTPVRQIKNIVFPNTLDTENQEDLVMKVKALQNFFQARLHIIWINTPTVFKPDRVIREQLKAFAQRYMLKDYTINVFNYSNEEAGILEYTRQNNGDLIAMGTQGLKGLAHLLSGSIAEDVVNHVEYPVWTYCTKSAMEIHNA